MALSTTDLQTVYTLLSNALSADENLRKPAEATLASYDNRPNFCSCLLEIIGTKNLDSQNNARWLASVYFKNSISRYWRQRRESTVISNEEKAYLRTKLLELGTEENHQIAVQLSVLISKIARFDYPKEWPDLFSVLVKQLQSSDILGSHRVYMILHRTMKELSSKRLSADQRNFAELTSQLYNYVWLQWKNDMKVIIDDLSINIQSHVGSFNSPDGQKALQLTCDRWLLCLKILKLMLLSGFQSDAKSVQEVPAVKDICPALLNAVQSLLPYRSVVSQGFDVLQSFIEKACLKSMKVLTAVQKLHPYSFSFQGQLVPILDFCYQKIICPEGHIATFGHFLIQCMILFKSILECKEYKINNTGRVVGDTNISLEQTKNDIARGTEEILKTFMINERAVMLCNILIRRYLILSSTDLDEWSQDPEGFHHQQDMIQWTEQLRPCAEALYLTLLYSHREVLGPLVVEILKEAMANCSAEQANVSPELLFMEAAYNAVGVGHYEISNNLTFKAWFEGALLPELHRAYANRHVIRRRVALILGQWVAEIKDSITKPAYYSLIALFQDKDLAVRLASCRSLCFLVQDLHFQEDDFAQYIPICLDVCFQTMHDVQEFDSKVQLLHLIAVLIDRLGEKLLPYMDKLMHFFPKVWEESGSESLLRIQVLVAIQNFVNALGPRISICFDMLMPILRYCIDINNPDELNLLEDGVLLWESVLNHATSLTSQLMDLFPNAVAIMEKSFDHLLVAMKIIESYILLGGVDFLRIHASGVVRILDIVVGNVNHKGLLSTFPVIEILIQCSPQDSASMLSGVLQKIIVIFISGDESDPSKSAVRTAAGTVVARLLVQNSRDFAQLIAQPASSALVQQAGINPDRSIIFCLVDSWLDKADSVTIFPRKAYALALCFLLTAREALILDRLEQIVGLCAGVLMSDDESENEDSSYEGKVDAASLSVHSKESRKRQVKLNDPLRNMSLADVLRENLQACASLHGETVINTAMSKLHPTVLGQLKQFLRIYFSFAGY